MPKPIFFEARALVRPDGRAAGPEEARPVPRALDTLQVRVGEGPRRRLRDFATSHREPSGTQTRDTGKNREKSLLGGLCVGKKISYVLAYRVWRNWRNIAGERESAERERAPGGGALGRGGEVGERF